MTGIAGEPGRVLRRDHLRKTLGFGGIGFVAAHAEYGSVGKLWYNGAGILNVPRQRSVTSFTPDIGVLALIFRLNLVCVTSLTGLVAGKFDGTRSNVVHGCGPKVAVFAEVARDNGVSQKQECHDAQGQQQYYSNQMFRVAQKILHAYAGQQFSDPGKGIGMLRQILGLEAPSRRSASNDPAPQVEGERKITRVSIISRGC